MSTLSPQVLDKLRKFDTPTICNLIELFEVRPRNVGYMDARIKAAFLEMPPMVGFAATATFRSAAPPAGGDGYASVQAQVERFGELSGPAIIVFQDLDEPSAAATFGEVMCTTYKAFGSTGLITSGTGRDFDQVRAIDFPVFTNGWICSHGYNHIPQIHVPVHIGGITIYPDDLLHGDCNGVSTIPHDIAAEVADVGDEFVAAETVSLKALRAGMSNAKQYQEARAEEYARVAALRKRVLARQQVAVTRAEAGMDSITLFAVPDLPLIQPGDDLPALIVERLAGHDAALQLGDIVVIAQKVVSKAEGRLVRIADVEPTPQAVELAERIGKEPAMIQVILDDSKAILRARRGLFVVEQRSGWICANAGVDRSNVAIENGDEYLALLPWDADASAAAIRERLAELTGVAPAVLITDSHGRAWRIGTTGVCIGCAGLPPVWDQRGLHDLYGYELMSSEECIADELAAAASLVMGQSDEGRPVVIVRGYHSPVGVPPAPATSIQRPAAMDAFR